LEALAEISSNPAGQVAQALQKMAENPPREIIPEIKEKKNQDIRKRSTDSKQSSVKKSENSKVSKVKLSVEYESKHGLNIYFTKFMISLLDMFKIDQKSKEPKEREYYLIIGSNIHSQYNTNLIIGSNIHSQYNTNLIIGSNIHSQYNTNLIIKYSLSFGSLDF
jgi:hypothetical protein